jgi:hypothetical protein
MIQNDPKITGYHPLDIGFFIILSACKNTPKHNSCEEQMVSPMAFSRHDQLSK